MFTRKSLNIFKCKYLVEMNIGQLLISSMYTNCENTFTYMIHDKNQYGHQHYRVNPM